MGGDDAIVQAARVSYGKGTKRQNEDRNLIHYLLRHRHSTPFEMCEIKFHVKLPIFVARQWIRHRTANVNEYSARYSILEKEFYLPDRSHLEESKKRTKTSFARKEGHPDMFGTAPLAGVAPQSASNKQGREGELDIEEAQSVIKNIHSESSRAYTFYLKLLNETEDGNVLDPKRDGLARELARMVLPVNYYTQWYWKIDLHNLMHFLSLRGDPHAQHEIRAYADVMLDILKSWVPLTYEAFVEHRLRAVTLSASALEVVKRQLAGELVTDPPSGMGKREWSELKALGLIKTRL